MIKRSVSSSLISHFVMLALIVAGVSFACISTPTPEPTEVPPPTKAPPEPTEVPPEPTEVPPEPTEPPEVVEGEWDLLYWTEEDAATVTDFLYASSDAELTEFLLDMDENGLIALEELLNHIADPELTAIVNSILEAAPTASWRIPPPPGAELVGDDTSDDLALEEIVAARAKELAIPVPYFWEMYDLPEGTRYPEVRTHYNESMIEQMYKMASDKQWMNNIYTLTYLHETIKNSKNAVIFYAETNQYLPFVIVIYSNPIE